MLDKGAKVYLAGRSKEKACSHSLSIYQTTHYALQAQNAIAKIKQDTGKSEIYFLHLDLDSAKLAHESAKSFLHKESRLDILYNNAGVMIVRPSLDWIFPLAYRTMPRLAAQG